MSENAGLWMFQRERPRWRDSQSNYEAPTASAAGVVGKPVRPGAGTGMLMALAAAFLCATVAIAIIWIRH